MSKYYIFTEDIKTGDINLLEITAFPNLKDARMYASKKYQNIVLKAIETGMKLVCISEHTYNQHYKKEA